MEEPFYNFVDFKAFFVAVVVSQHTESMSKNDFI